MLEVAGFEVGHVPLILLYGRVSLPIHGGTWLDLGFQRWGREGGV